MSQRADLGMQVVVSNSLGPVKAGFVRVFRLAHEVLREIFDEAAYSRYLARHALASSTDTYGAFLREADQTLEHKPRCC